MRAGFHLRGGLVLVLLLVTAFLTAPALAQEQVPLRTWQHSDFARMVFDWPNPVGYSASVAGRVLTVRFDRPAQVNLATARQRLSDYISTVNVDPDGLGLRFELTRDMTVSDFTNEGSIVIDLRPVAGQTAEAPPPEPASQSAPQPIPQGGAVQGEGPALGIRVGEHPGYSRIVFDWPQAVPYEVERNGRAVSIDFARAASVDVAALQAGLPPGIRVDGATAADGRLRMVFAVPDAAELRHFPLEEKVVLDILASAAIRNQPATPLPTDALPPTAQADPQTPQSSPVPTPEVTPDPVPEPASEPPPEAAALERSEEERAEQALAEGLESGQITFRDGVIPDNAPSEIPADTPADPPSEPAAERPPVPSPEQASPLNQEEQQAEAPPPVPEGPALVTYSIGWTEDVGAAAFRRNDNIWVIFDSATTIELSDMRVEGAPIVQRIDQLPISGATVLRMQVPDRNINISARREGFSWVLDFRPGPQRPQYQAPIIADVTADIGPHLGFPTETPGDAINIPDPEMGDVMRVATFLESGMGIDGLRRYPEFELLPTAQGVALIRLSDSVLLDRNFDGFQVSAPDGLAISAVSPEAPVASGPVLSARRLFDLNGLMRGQQSEYPTLSAAVFRSLAEVPYEKINAARLDYAGFLMAHGRGHESLGVLGVVEEDDPQVMARAENQALKAAASVLAGRPDDARALLNDPRLDGFAEAAIWRGAALAQAGDYLAANEAFGPGDSLLSRYPFPLKATLGLLRIDTAFANRDVRGAEAWVSALERDRGELTVGERAALDFQRARLAIARTDFELGEELLREVIASGDRKYAYRAEQTLITLGLREGFMEDAEALERMERLRYAWRGDRAELHLLRRLGELYLAQPDYFEGLGVYRTAVKYFAGDPVAEDLAGEMTDIFRNLFLEGKADELPPLRAIALYEEFKELTPTGRDGDRIIENIADRLAAIDLLAEAAEHLGELLRDEERLPPGEERVRLSNKLALIHLMDGKPLLAEEAISSGRRGLALFDLDDELEADRDRLLARAKIQQGDYDAAIKELAGDVSVEADLLRRDLYRTTQNWQESAKVLQRLAGNPPDDPAEGVEGERARYVINWAVALYQNNDRDGLRDLLDLWAPTMANSSLSGVFDYITNQNRSPTGDDVMATVDQLIGADRFDAFLKAYRERLFAPPPPPTAEVVATSS